MNLGQGVDQFRARVRDTALPYLWDDTFVEAAFNEAEREACIRAKLLYDETTPEVCDIDITSASAVYTPHAKIDEIRTAYLTDSYGINHAVAVIDRVSLHRNYPSWYDHAAERPRFLVQEEKTITVFPTPDAAYTLTLGAYRLPLVDMEVSVDEPEITAVHHEGLIDWVEFRAYSIPDADTFDAGRAAKAEIAFIRRFGQRPDANVRRKQRDRRPHVVRPIGF